MVIDGYCKSLDWAKGKLAGFFWRPHIDSHDFFVVLTCREKLPSYFFIQLTFVYSQEVVCIPGVVLRKFAALECLIQASVNLYGFEMVRTYTWLVVWNMNFIFHILGRIIPTDEVIFFRGVETTNQYTLFIDSTLFDSLTYQIRLVGKIHLPMGSQPFQSVPEAKTVVKPFFSIVKAGNSSCNCLSMRL